MSEPFNIPPKPEEVEILPSVIKHITELTDEEREKILCPRSRESYERCKKNDLYDCKKDRCKEMRDQKAREEKEKSEKVVILSQRNEILEDHARKLEIEFKEYKNQTEERFNKLATLIASLK